MQTTRRRRGLIEESKPAERDRLVLHYDTTDGRRVILRGQTGPHDSIEVVLDRVERPYALSPNSLPAGRYNDR